jgi:hypothetical protein
MQSTPPSPEHHANASRSLFKNPWMVAESSAAPPPNSTTTQGTSSYWCLPFPSISIERVRTSDSHPHPPVKVVKPDWGKTSAAAVSEQPNLKATWLGHAVRRGNLFLSPALLTYLFYFRAFWLSFRVLSLPQARMTNHLASCLTLSSQTPPVRLLGLVFGAVCPLPAPLRSCQSFNSWYTLITSVCCLRWERYPLLARGRNTRSYDHLDLPTLQQIYALRRERVHFLVPLGRFCVPFGRLLILIVAQRQQKVVRGNRDPSFPSYRAGLVGCCHVVHPSPLGSEAHVRMCPSTTQEWYVQLRFFSRSKSRPEPAFLQAAA